MLNSAAALAVLAGCGLLAGWHPHRGMACALGAFGLLLLLRFAFVWIGIYLGLTFYPNPGAVTAVRTLEFPIGWPLLLIAVFFPLSLHRYRRLSH